MTAALEQAVSPDTATRAQAFAARVELHGATIAADRLIREFAA